MKPVKLKLRNFMCYRDNVPPLVFEGVHVACLCGENGAGKSSLLDAITWALWGQTSRTRSDDDLIHLGRTEMEVELEFIVSDTLYRVVRKRERGAGKRAGHTILEFHISTGSPGDAFVAIGGNSVRDTEEKIRQTLRMDFETFVNSAFLVQGRADEFTTKPPDKRKQVLADILNLREYDELEERARSEAKRCRDEGQLLDIAIQELEQQLRKKEEYLRRAKDVEAGLAVKGEELKAHDAEAVRLRLAAHALEQKQAQAAAIRQRLAQLDDELARLRKRSDSLGKDIVRDEAAVAGAEAIAAEHARLQAVAAEKEALDTRASAYLRATQQRSRLEQAIARAAAGMEKEQVKLAGRVQDLQAKASGRDRIAAELGETEQGLEALHPVEAKVRDARASLQSLAGEISTLEADNKALRKDMDDTRARMEQLGQGHGVCPLCGTELGEDRCAGVLDQYRAQGTEKADAYRANTARIAQLKLARVRVDRDLAGWESQVKAQQAALQPRMGFLLHKMEEAGAAVTDLPLAQDKLAEAERRLGDGFFAVDEHKALAEVASAIQALGYDQEAHARVRAEYDRLRPVEGRFRLLEEAQRRLPQARDLLAELVKDTAGREASAAQDRILLDGLARDLVALPRLAADLAREEQSCRSLAGAVDRLQQELGAARRDLARLDEGERSRAEKRLARAAAAEEQSVYEELATAFGRKGVQALIIESAIPEIEEEANNLLARMTDHRMSVRLETQVSYRSREGEKETLDIQIADELGTRKYETFSGGEAFRVNVALRIALSRLLAKRAGAPLPTLFIDEGFGTQDIPGRDKLVETINSIQGQFERILVITHIEELKEQFPTRIEVVKTPEGSTFSLV